MEREGKEKKGLEENWSYCLVQKTIAEDDNNYPVSYWFIISFFGPDQHR